ncbi:MAG TPA: FtsQ-type POTRA domain-containing protein, partial [Candidatus Limnocylindria bacterium]|nr:FtsQ-type POTRA domain-containing protein [Candidatus Limnocylindria bacterium]
RIARRLPRPGRMLAAFLAAATLAGLVALVSGPWLRVAGVGWRGERLTPSDAIADRLVPLHGAPLLAVDTTTLAARLETLPAVADARVRALLPGRVDVTLTEKRPELVWQTRGARFLGAADGTLLVSLPVDAPLTGELAAMPRVVDARRASRYLEVGDVLPATLLDTARRLASLDPARLGSAAGSLALKIEDEHGFVLVPRGVPWRAAFGFYGAEPGETADEVAARVERQVTAVRTLFATHPESTVGWVDARNPGKVYFRAGG